MKIMQDLSFPCVCPMAPGYGCLPPFVCSCVTCSPQDNGSLISSLAGMLQEAEEAFEGNAMTMEMLEKLQQLPWRRIDADFSATSMPFFAHNLIQVSWVEPDTL